MIYSDFKGMKLSRLGFGAMRLPMNPDGRTIDESLTEEMVDKAYRAGVNYFDTAYVYHNGTSEIVLGKALAKYPRDSWYIADKYPGHQPSKTYDPAPVFEDQLLKCGVGYFDFYLLHNVMEFSMDTYMNPEYGIVDYFVEQRRQGRIKHLGFSSHASADNLEKFLDSPYGKEMEFCQIQLNYVDWSLQDAERKCRILSERNIPVWVMEPVRGGKLASFDEGSTSMLRDARPDESTAAWAFRWLQGLDNVKVILSGMSNMDQVEDNLGTFAVAKPLDEKEKALIENIGRSLLDMVPCTACRYCCEACPQELDIPKLIGCCNDLRLQNSLTPGMMVDALPADKKPDACLGCGACMQMCPQGIDIPSVMTELAEKLSNSSSWTEICRTRDREARELNITRAYGEVL